MRVLVVKTSSMGDVIHTLPALTDAVLALRNIRFDWVVEEGLAEIPSWHPAVDRVIPIALRRWRKQPLRAMLAGEWRQYRADLREREYDAVIDAQGLVKSALLTVRLARGPSFGPDRNSAREPMAARFYQHAINLPKQHHAVERTRLLFSRALGYSLPAATGQYGIREGFPGGIRPRTLFFAHGTTWRDKHWPEAYWIELAGKALEAGFRVELPWGSEAEQARARRIAGNRPGITLLPRSTLAELAARIATSEGVVSVDTGLSHLAAALDRPNVVLFGPTDPGLVGGYGKGQIVLKASEQPPVARRTEPQLFAPLTPAIVWAHLLGLLAPQDESGGQDQPGNRI